MSATTTTDTSGVQSPTVSPPTFTDWQPARDEEPTEQEEQEARERSLDVGNVTEIDWKNAPNNDGFYERLDLHNRDCVWKYRNDVSVSESADKQFKRHTLYALAGELGLNSLQRRKAFDRLFELHLSRSGMRTDVVAFCLCALVLKEDAERHGEDNPYHPARNPENNDDRFALVETQLIEVDGQTSKNYIQKVWGKLTQGNPPTRCESEWKSFVKANSLIQNHPSHRPNLTLES